MKVITDRRFVCTKLHIYIFIAVRSIILHTLFSVYEIQPHWLSTEKRLYCIQFQTYFHRIGGVMVKCAHLEYCRSWVQASVGSNQRL